MHDEIPDSKEMEMNAVFVQRTRKELYIGASRH